MELLTEPLEITQVRHSTEHVNLGHTSINSKPISTIELGESAPSICTIYASDSFIAP